MANTILASDLPDEAQRAMLDRAVRGLVAEGVTGVGVYPAGRHTRRHGVSWYAACGIDRLAVLDDLATGEIDGVAIRRPGDAGALEGLGAVVISADLRDAEFAERARAWAEPAGLRVVRPYAGFGPADAAFRVPSDEIARLRDTFTGRLNLGCGPHPLPGWTNVDGGDGERYEAPDHPDVIALDAFRAMAALPDGSCSLIYSEHFYEHFTLAEGFDMAREWRRLLAPGGTVRIVTPDLARIAKDILGIEPLADPAIVENHRRAWLADRHVREAGRFFTPAMVANFGMRLEGHKFIYDEDTLGRQLGAAGLTGVRRLAFGASDVPGLAGIDRHDGGASGGEWLKRDQLIVEATRP